MSGIDGVPMTFEGHWLPTIDSLPTPTPHELELDEDARTGRPSQFTVCIDGLEYFGEARIVRNGPGSYTFEPLSKLRRRLSRPPNPDPQRLPA